MKKAVLLGVDGFGGQWPKPCKLNDIEIVAIVDNCEESRIKAARELNIVSNNVFDGSDLSWVNVKGADIIIEATAPGKRVDRVLAALESGKDVIMAKPPVLCMEDLYRIHDAKEKYGKEVHVVTQKRYFPAYRRIKNIIENENLGKLVYADVNLRVDGTYWKSGFYWRKKLPYPSLIDGSIHHFDLINWWTGAKFVDVLATSWNPEWSPFDNNCDVSAVYTLDNGATVSYKSRWSMKEGPVINYFEGIRLEFQNGVLEVIGGKLYQNGTYIPIISDGTTMMDTGELNIYILSDILKSIADKKDYYHTSVDNHIEPFKVIIASVASIINEKKVDITTFEEHLEELGVSKEQMDKMMESVFVRE